MLDSLDASKARFCHRVCLHSFSFRGPEKTVRRLVVHLEAPEGDSATL